MKREETLIRTSSYLLEFIHSMDPLPISLLLSAEISHSTTMMGGRGKTHSKEMEEKSITLGPHQLKILLPFIAR